MKPTNSPPQPEGVDVSVRHTDGRTETVRVLKLPREQIPEYSRVIGQGNEDLECALFTGRDAAWARSLDDASFDRVMDQGQDLNLAAYISWNARQQRKMAALRKNHPDLARQITKLAEAEFNAPVKPTPPNNLQGN